MMPLVLIDFPTNFIIFKNKLSPIRLSPLTSIIEPFLISNYHQLKYKVHYKPEDKSNYHKSNLQTLDDKSPQYKPIRIYINCCLILLKKMKVKKCKI